MKVQLWLEGEEACIDIPMAVVSGIHTPCITVGVIRVSPSDRMRLKRFLDAPTAMHIEKPALITHLLIRAQREVGTMAPLKPVKADAVIATIRGVLGTHA